MLKQGLLLIASPLIDHGLYAKSVLLICEHEEEGTIGILINKLLPVSSEVEKKAIQKLEDNQIVTLLGGPLHPDEAFMLHNNKKLKEQSIELGENVFLGSLLPLDSEDISSKVRLIFGYSAWPQGALEQEIEKGFWIPVDLNESSIFMTPKLQYRHLLKNLGGRFKVFAHFPEKLELN